ncbi:hypothetical protein SAMN05192529_1481 [Arachidicoccus rhizosphaerae]|uniref:Uncharacterized protein n=1 Tax=Arachidicoccus rhizosphaerae TaxID=551991 RepID=A0A1H4D7U6_9BACT|nr:hypothetical protein SAMN05192529_1481 [Arachidicoccus rhizosphaerae]
MKKKIIAHLLKTSLITFIISSITFQSCKKEIISPNNNSKLQDSLLLNKLLDSLFIYASQTYYWNNQLPTYNSFNPHKYNQDNIINSLTNEQFDLTRYPKNDHGELYEQLQQSVLDFTVTAQEVY